MTTPDPKLTVRTATQEFRVRRRTMRRLLRDGSVIGAERVGSGREWLIPRQSLIRIGLEPRRGSSTVARRWPLIAVCLAAVVAILAVGITVTDDDDGTVATAPDNAASSSTGGDDQDEASSGAAPDDADDVTAASPGGESSTTTTSATASSSPIGPPAHPTTSSPDDDGQSGDLETGSDTADNDPSEDHTADSDPTDNDSADEGSRDSATDDAAGDSPNATDRGQHEVVAGDNLWTIAAQTLRAQTPDASDADVIPYWQAVIDANADQLVDAGNPDLILPGQVLTLPSTSIVGGPVAASP